MSRPPRRQLFPRPLHFPLKKSSETAFPSLSREKALPPGAGAGADRSWKLEMETRRGIAAVKAGLCVACLASGALVLLWSFGFGGLASVAPDARS
ncbi:hypothetical protein ACJRO7_014541 [Eucalyptus globulus]|uniref:Uncharacterized protein n=1 Tax=Eucalyptus globulus TaxID=34317 RepID=A0ABD3L4C2_EUCGL